MKTYFLHKITAECGCRLEEGGCWQRLLAGRGCCQAGCPNVVSQSWRNPAPSEADPGSCMDLHAGSWLTGLVAETRCRSRARCHHHRPLLVSTSPESLLQKATWAARCLPTRGPTCFGDARRVRVNPPELRGVEAAAPACVFGWLSLVIEVWPE